MVRTIYRTTSKNNFNNENIDPYLVPKRQGNFLDFQSATLQNNVNNVHTPNTHVIPLCRPLATSTTVVNESDIYLPTSSPIKRIPNFQNNCDTDDIKNYDLTSFCQPQGFNSEKCKKFISDEVQKLQNIDGQVQGYLQKLNELGVCDLGLEDVSYGMKSSPIKYSAIAHNPGFKFYYLSTHAQTEAVICIPKTEVFETVKNKLVSYLKEELIESQTGKIKIKVVILTPRSDASWLQRKISTTDLDDSNQFEFVIVRVRNSFIQKVKDCLNNFLQVLANST